MRSSYVAISLLHLVFCLFFIGAGVLIFRVSNSLSLSLEVSRFLLNHSYTLKMISILLIALSILCLMLLTFLHRRKYYEVAINSQTRFSVDPELLKSYVQDFWTRELKQEGDLLKEVYLDQKGNLYISAGLLGEPKLEKLENLEERLANLLKEKTGFKKTLFLKVF